MGKPVPAQVTRRPDTVQPEICWLAALMGTPLATKSAIALGMLSPQSPGNRSAVGIAGAGQRRHRRRGDAVGISYVVALAFVGAEEERFVFDNRAAQAAAELFQGSRSFGAGEALK